MPTEHHDFAQHQRDDPSINPLLFEYSLVS